MKKNGMMRAAGVLLALTLITSSFVGGTFAKYTTKAEGKDTARVAKFGITLESKNAAFGKQYGGNGTTDSDAVTAGTEYSVYSASANLVAPGTKGSVDLVKIGVDAPEVAVEVTASLGTTKQITLPVHNGYPDDTHIGETFDVKDDPYHPVVWTLSRKTNSATTKLVEGKSLAEVEAYLTGTLSGNYYPDGSTLETKDIADLAGTYTLSWEWPFYKDAETDKMDTYLGNEIAGAHDSTVEGIVTDEAFDFTITVTQID